MELRDKFYVIDRKQAGREGFAIQTRDVAGTAKTELLCVFTSGTASGDPEMLWRETDDLIFAGFFDPFEDGTGDTDTETDTDNDEPSLD